MKFAFASLKYHKRSTLVYSLLLILGCTLLLFINSLLESLPLIFNQAKELVSSSGYQQEEQLIWQQLQQHHEELKKVYLYLRNVRLPLLLFLFFLYYLVSQMKKNQELFAWYQSGSSISSWIRFNLVEHLVPILFLTITYGCMILIFQDSIGNFLLNIHLKLMNSLNKLTIHVQITEDETLNRLLVRFPTTNQALVSSIQLSSQQWLKILFTALWKTMLTTVAILAIIHSCITGSYSYWRYHQWKKQSL